MRVAVYEINTDRCPDPENVVKQVGNEFVCDASVFDRKLLSDAPWYSLRDAYAELSEGGYPLFRSDEMLCGNVLTLCGAGFTIVDGSFRHIRFDESKAQVLDDPYRVVYVEPGRPAFEAEVGRDPKWMRKAVMGNMECLNEHGDDTVIVANAQARELRLFPNRHTPDGRLIAGPFFVIGKGENGDFRSLTNEEVQKYIQQYPKPTQSYLQEEAPRLSQFMQSF